MLSENRVFERFKIQLCELFILKYKLSSLGNQAKALEKMKGNFAT